MSILSNNYAKIILGTTSLILLIIIIHKFQSQNKNPLNQKVKISAETLYTDQKEILENVREIVLKGNHYEIGSLENKLVNMNHIESAEIFFNVDGLVSLSYHEFEPVVRVFSSENKSFYLDSNCNRIPLSKKHTADVILFTGYTENIKDYLMLDLGKKIRSNKFLFHQVSEIYINESKEAFYIPTVGNHKIKIGSFKNIDLKINKLLTFYNKIIPMQGWKKYSQINLEFKNQIICLKND